MYFSDHQTNLQARRRVHASHFFQRKITDDVITKLNYIREFFDKKFKKKEVVADIEPNFLDYLKCLFLITSIFYVMTVFKTYFPGHGQNLH
jgi:hypothetical protein